MSDLQSKTDEELNRMLAELAGWINIRKNHRGLIGTVPPERGFHWEEVKFTDSLDEVAKVEAGLTDEQWVAYTERHLKALAQEMPRKSCCLIGATARQRTIALIQTLTP